MLILLLTPALIVIIETVYNITRDNFRLKNLVLSFLTACIIIIRCEADPAALAKYVLALIKKDKSEEELRKSMVAQLDVFLEGGKYT